jgi:hypothetical protein
VKAVRGLIALAAAAAAGMLAAGALALPAKAPRNFRAQLTAANEVPAPAHVPKHAGGRFTGTLRGRTLTWNLRFHTLSGKVTAAHIHLGLAGSTGPVLLPLCAPCDARAQGTVRLTGAEITALVRGKTYVDVHTVRNPGGEIRGQTGLRKPS